MSSQNFLIAIYYLADFLRKRHMSKVPPPDDVIRQTKWIPLLFIAFLKKGVSNFIRRVLKVNIFIFVHLRVCTNCTIGQIRHFYSISMDL